MGYFVYIMTNAGNSVLYTGVTNNLVRRVHEHKNKIVKGFTAKYAVSKLVYYEVADSPIVAIEREKQIKGGSRKKKLDLIMQNNPEFRDLYSTILEY